MDLLSNYKEFLMKTEKYLTELLPEGIDIEGIFYESMCSVGNKSYILRDLDGKLTIKGVSLKSRGMEKFGQEFISKSIQLILDSEQEKIKYLYRKLKDDIQHNRLPIEYFCLSREVKKTPERYLLEKKTTQRTYELMIRTGRTVPVGKKILYYESNGMVPKFADEYDPDNPDVDIKYLLDKLDNFTHRLYNTNKPHDSILTEIEYESIFKSESPQLMLDFDVYNLTDFYCSNAENNKWDRQLNTIENVINYTKENPIDSFRTVQSFRTENKDDEKHMCDLYFDIDAEVSDNVKEQLKKTDNVTEKLKLVEDIINTTKEDTKKIIQFFIKKFGFSKNDFEIYFSGFKGFHIFIPREKFGITKGRNDLTYIYKIIATKLEKELELKNIDIGSIYSKRRMMRLPFTINSKSGLMKIPVRYDVLFEKDNKITTVIGSIQQKLLSGKYTIEQLYDGLLKILPKRNVNEVVQTWFYNIIKEFEENSIISACRKPTYKFIKLKTEPMCVQDILRSGIRKRGDRNKATLVLATYFKDKGISEKETFDKILKWALDIPKELTSSTRTQTINSTKTAVKTVYSGNRYYFSCASIRSLGVAGFKVPCLKSCSLAE